MSETASEVNDTHGSLKKQILNPKMVNQFLIMDENPKQGRNKKITRAKTHKIIT